MLTTTLSFSFCVGGLERGRCLISGISCPSKILNWLKPESFHNSLILKDLQVSQNHYSKTITDVLQIIRQFYKTDIITGACLWQQDAGNPLRFFTQPIGDRESFLLCTMSRYISIYYSKVNTKSTNDVPQKVTPQQQQVCCHCIVIYT